MRGIGNGQTVRLLIPPSVYQLMCEQAALGCGESAEACGARMKRLPSHKLQAQVLRDMCGWAVLNSITSEQVACPPLKS